jgi:hypothetical protein
MIAGVWARGSGYAECSIVSCEAKSAARERRMGEWRVRNMGCLNGRAHVVGGPE